MEPNIVIIEIDSVSAAYADRHLPKTRAFLRSLREEHDHDSHNNNNNTRPDHDSADEVKPSGVVSVSFPLFTAVGAATVHNGVASLAGCVAVYDGPQGPRTRTAQALEQWLPGFTRFDLQGRNVRPKPSFVANPPRLAPFCQTTPENFKQRRRLQGLGTPGLGMRLHAQAQASPQAPQAPQGPQASQAPHARRSLSSTQDQHQPLHDQEQPSDPGVGSGGGWVNPWLFDVAKRRGFVTLHAHEFCAHGSPFVVHTHFEQVGVLDHVLDNLYCKIATRETKKDAAAAWMRVEGHCLAGQFRHEWPLGQIEQLFDVYPDIPKIAFVNSIVAHDYTVRWEEMPLKVEALDGPLESFLRRMLARPDHKNTVFVLRGDHGLQGGPSTVDFATQVEQRRPMLELIVPRTLLERRQQHQHQHRQPAPFPLVANGGRLVTAWDMYSTLLNLIAPDPPANTPPAPALSGRSLKAGPAPNTPPAPPILVPSLPALKPRHPPWSLDLIGAVVPPDRTCQHARVPVDFCACANEFEQHERSQAWPGGNPQAPHFGVCNFASYAEQSKYCVGEFL